MSTQRCRTLVAGLILFGLGCAGGVTVDVHGQGKQPIPSHITFAVLPLLLLMKRGNKVGTGRPQMAMD